MRTSAVGPSIQASGLGACGMGQERWSGLMGQGIKESGRSMKLQKKESLHSQMVTFTKEAGQ